VYVGYVRFAYSLFHIHILFLRTILQRARSWILSESVPAFRRVKLPAQTGIDGSDGHPVENIILAGLPRSISQKLVQKSQFVTLPIHAILNEADAPIQQVYFLNSGLASILSVLRNGKSVEVGLTGKEGFVGIPIAAGYKTSPTRVIIQIEGNGFRIGAKEIAALMNEHPALERGLQKYSQEVALQASQIAACNRVHEVNQRLARWLLMSQDRIGGNSVPLTQEFLAHMLGTRRASVTVAAGSLQRDGLISYVRGQLKIEDRARLEAASCECYATLNRQLQAWQAESR
jgi:CRP-like cAMP-binding protein